MLSIYIAYKTINKVSIALKYVLEKSKETCTGLEMNRIVDGGIQKLRVCIKPFIGAFTGLIRAQRVILVIITTRILLVNVKPPFPIPVKYIDSVTVDLI